MIRGWIRPALRVAIIAAAAVSVIAGASVPSPASSPAPTRVEFTWTMSPRFGLDVDEDGLVEIENTPEYTHNRVPDSCPGPCPEIRLSVHLSAAPSPAALGLPTSGFLTYEWRISGPAGPATYHRTKPELDLLLPEGDHEVDLRVRVRLPWGSVTLRRRGAMPIDDLLVVAVGDSYPSGEGSPDVRRDEGEAHWADASDPIVAEQHDAAHRSTVGWPAGVAMALEEESDATSVTFVDVAASGSRIDRGLLAPRTGPGIPAQLDEVARIVQDRPIDVLLIQIGGNDVGFSRAIRALVEADPQLNPFCYETKVANVWASVSDGVWDRGVELTYDPPFDFGCRTTGGTEPIVPGLDGLDDALTRLSARLSELSIERVLLVEYPDPTGGTPGGDQCPEIVGDVTAPFGFHEVDANEQSAGLRRVLDPLNNALRSAAETHGWIWVGGVASTFSEGHGYCAPWPDYGYPDEFEDSPLLFRYRLNYPDGWYRPSARGGESPLHTNVSWYRTAAQSAALQGPTPRFLTSGTLHPNEIGHAAIARMVVAALTPGD